MPDTQLTNPAGAYGYTAFAGAQYFTLIAGATLTAGQAVAFGTGATAQQAIVCTAALYPIGVAMNAAVAGGQVDVMVKGIITMTAGTGGTTIQTPAGVLAAGAVGPTSAVIGQNIGVALATVAAAATCAVWVSVV